MELNNIVFEISMYNHICWYWGRQASCNFERSGIEMVFTFCIICFIYSDFNHLSHCTFFVEVILIITLESLKILNKKYVSEPLKCFHPGLKVFQTFHIFVLYFNIGTWYHFRYVPKLTKVKSRVIIEPKIVQCNYMRYSH